MLPCVIYLFIRIAHRMSNQHQYRTGRFMHLIRINTLLSKLSQDIIIDINILLFCFFF